MDDLREGKPQSSASECVGVVSLELGLSETAVGLTNASECNEPMLLESKGRVPEWLTGSLYLLAAGSFDLRGMPVEHWLDVLPLLLHFEFTLDGLQFTSRLLYKEAPAIRPFEQRFLTWASDFQRKVQDERPWWKRWFTRPEDVPQLHLMSHSVCLHFPLG